MNHFNTSYLNDSYINFTLKMESVPEITSFGLKMMVKGGLEKIFLKFLHVGDYSRVALLFFFGSFSFLHTLIRNYTLIKFH